MPDQSTSAERHVLTASILGSGAVFLESTVVNVALPAIGRDLGLGLGGLQWIVNAYLLTLGSLILLGGALGDRYPRDTIFRVGAAGFALTSGLCAVAPNVTILAVLRALQGVAGALLVPNSLALLETAFSGQDKGAAIGKWSAGSAASTAIGPLAGGAIVAVASWRWVFVLVVPFALLAAVSLPRLPTPPGTSAPPARRVDYLGAMLVTAGLGALVAALIAGPSVGFSDARVLGGLAAGGALLVAFLGVERTVADPLVPLDVWRSRQFVGANAMTFLVYGALGVVLFLLMLVLQNVAGYTALQAGAALLPVNVFLFLLSSPAGRLGARIGPRGPMAVGSVLAGGGLALLTRLHDGASYVSGVLPGVMVFGLGLALLVAPLTASVLESLGTERAGLASGVNNAVARVAGLIATAAIPLAAGFGGLTDLTGADLTHGFQRAMWICAGLCAAGGIVTWFTIRGQELSGAQTGLHPGRPNQLPGVS